MFDQNSTKQHPNGGVTRRAQRTTSSFQSLNNRFELELWCDGVGNV